ncbi:MAG TPA: heavy metal-binding domain-containing protein [Phenylobacterium sp.]|nr:heavy metal-binding domain-containing protein [Phenylobacterium sp.]
MEGRPVRQHLGMVSSQAILGANVVLDLMNAIRDFIGGRSKGYERILAQARADAMRGLEAEARAIGANAVLGVDLDYNTVGPNGSMLMVSVNGSAVIL